MTPSCAPVERGPRGARIPRRSEVDVDRLGAALDDHLTVRALAASTRVSTNTVYRWQDYGCRGLDGVMHVLPFLKVGARRYTRKADLAAFLDALNARI